MLITRPHQSCRLSLEIFSEVVVWNGADGALPLRSQRMQQGLSEMRSEDR